MNEREEKSDKSIEAIPFLCIARPIDAKSRADVTRSRFYASLSNAEATISAMVEENFPFLLKIQSVRR